MAVDARAFPSADPTAEPVPAAVRQERIERLREAALRPGLSAAGPTTAAETVMFRHFPDAREGDRLRFQPCHYIGQDYAEFPTGLVSRPPNHGRALGPGAPASGDVPLEAGMTIELHPNLRPPGLGLASVGDVFVVAPVGGERLSAYPAGFVIVEPR